MKRLPFLLPILFCSQSCHHASKVTPVIISQDYEKGKAFLGRKNDSAFYYFNRATTFPNRLLIAKAYNKMAIIQTDAGDYFGSQENLLSSMKYLDTKKEDDQVCICSNYNELGYSNFNLKNYGVAVAYYDKALELTASDAAKMITLNNKALAYQQLHQYQQSIAIYQSIIDQTKSDKKNYARVLTNMAYTKWLRDSNYHADRELLAALQIRKDEKDDLGLNSSYAHLSDYYVDSKTDSSLYYAEKMYTVAKELNSPDDVLEALQKLIKLGPPAETKFFFAHYQSLNDSLQTSRNNAKNQFALIRYEATKNKEDNLILQKDNAEKNLRIIELAVGLSIVIAVFIVGIFWYRKRKQDALRKQQLKISQKVHDELANGIYRLMGKIEHGVVIEKEQLLDYIEDLYKRSRNISYEQPENLRKDESVAELLESFGNNTTRILIAGDPKEIWNKLKAKTKKELMLVLQELMTNMKKHSLAKNVAVKFQLQENNLTINYTDDGIGLPTTVQYGNGLKNTENRIKSIGGNISFENTTPGLKIRIHVPIAKQHD